MKRLLPVLAFMLAPAAASADIDLGEATSALREASALCRQAPLWKRDLCGPMLIVDPATRQVVANQAGPSLKLQGEVFVGVLPEGFPVANTAVDWEGVKWTMVMAGLPADRYDRAALLMHEAFHREQESLGFPMRSSAPDHLSTLEGRLLLRLEFRALAAAVTAKGEAARRLAIADALGFRAARRAQAGAGAEQEREQEINEGLAEYTGRRMSGDPALDTRIAGLLAKAEAKPSFARSFAYGTGPAYGVLLDRYAPDWRATITGRDDLGALLAAAVKVRPDPAAVDSAGAPYGYTSLRAEETAAFVERDRQAKVWTAKLVEGPVLRLPLQQLQISFNPNQVFPLPPHGTAYPSLTLTETWGALKVEGGGALISGDWSVLTLAAPAAGESNGDGWTLTLAPGWRFKPGDRPGDVTVVKAE